MADVIPSSFIGNYAGIGRTILWVLIGLVVFVLIYFVIFSFNNKKKYDYTVRIFRKDANGDIIEQSNEKGGIFIDKKTNFRLFFFKKLKFGMNPDTIPYKIKIVNTFFGQKAIKIVNVMQTGLRNYQYLTPVFGNPKLEFMVNDTDVANAVNAYERNTKQFSNLMMQNIIAVGGMVFVFLTIVIGLYLIFKEGGFNADLIRQLSANAKEISQNMVQAAGVTVVK
jgi:hypothetical protein